MKKTIILLLLLLLTTIIKAQTQIESIQFIGINDDSLEFNVYSSISGGVISEYFVEYQENGDNINVNILYSEELPHADCYCPVQTNIKIKKDFYSKAIVSIMIRYAIGGTEENPIYSDKYQLIDSKEIDLLNISTINNLTTPNKIQIYPNLVQNIFHIDLGESKVVNLEIYNTQGYLLLKKNITSDNGIDISFLSSGLYFVFIDKKYINSIIKK